MGSGSSSKSDDRKGVAVNAYLWRASLIFPPAATRKRPSAPNVPKALIA